jgi:6-phosphogluconolactonase (cycloisomerase 2 family)
MRRHQRLSGGPDLGRLEPRTALEIVNPSFLTLDRARRFLYSVHADLDEVSAYAVDKQTGHITPLNR